MKKTIISSITTLFAALACVSCVQDLDTMPIDPSVNTADKAFADPASYAQYVSYAYGYFAMVSQSNPGETDLAGFTDAGQSEFIRQYMVLNELPTDSFKCGWGDSYIPEIGYNKWGSSCLAVTAVYLRGMKGIALCNHFLASEVSGDEAVRERGHADQLGNIHRYRAELRLIRAIYYSILLDMIGNPPIVEPKHIGSSDFPKQFSKNFAEGRRMLFEYLETELKSIAADESLPAVRTEYPRLSKGAAWAVLARMYLNAEVYSGTARWDDAMTYSKKVIEEGGFSLNQGTGAEGYLQLFMQDNTESGAALKEFIIPISYDNTHTQSWGGTTHLVSGPLHNAEMAMDLTAKLYESYPELKSAYSKFLSDNSDNEKIKEYSVDNVYVETWNGYHISESFVEENFELENVESGAFNYNGDPRARFYKFDAAFSNESTDNSSGYTCVKWLPVNSDGTVADYYDPINHTAKLSSCDFPLYRLAEMYLIYAEAQTRSKNAPLTSGDEGYQYLKDLRDRVHYDMPSAGETIDAEWILKERVRELMWEGHRRTDLIRYDKFINNKAWPYKGGVAAGTQSSIEPHRIVYPIIGSDLAANPALVQNPGY